MQHVGAAEATGHPAHRLRGDPVNPIWPKSNSWWFLTSVNESCNLLSSLKARKVASIQTNASPHLQWSAGRIKLVDWFIRMTEEIFQGEGGGKLLGNPAALWDFIVKVTVKQNRAIWRNTVRTVKVGQLSRPVGSLRNKFQDLGQRHQMDAVQQGDSRGRKSKVKIHDKCT